MTAVVCILWSWVFMASVLNNGAAAASTGLGETVGNSGRIVNLYDAFGELPDGAIHDFGFSAYVEYGETRILFDAGTDADILRQNAQAIGIDLTTVDFAVASHSHADHISGFDYLLEINPDVKIYFPDDFFGGAAPIPFNLQGTDPGVSSELPDHLRYFGGGVDNIVIRPSGRFWKADVEYVKETRSVVDGVTLVVTRSPFTGAFSRYPNLGPTGEPSDSDVNLVGLPELSLVLQAEESIVVLVGCAHSTVEAIVAHAKEVTGSPASLVMGGYHLLPYAESEVRLVANRLRDDLDVSAVAPAHCTGHLGFKVLLDEFGDRFVPAGLGSKISF